MSARLLYLLTIASRKRWERLTHAENCDLGAAEFRGYGPHAVMDCMIRRGR